MEQVKPLYYDAVLDTPIPLKVCTQTADLSLCGWCLYLMPSCTKLAISQLTSGLQHCYLDYVRCSPPLRVTYSVPSNVQTLPLCDTEHILQHAFL